MKIIEYFQQTQETIEREATADEKAALELLQSQEKARKEAEDEAAKNNADRKKAVLEKLGLTAEEAAVLLG